MLIKQLWDSFYSSFANGSQGPVVLPAAESSKKEAENSKKYITPEDDLQVTNPVDEEINQLARALGGIHRGQVIELTLQELLQYVPKKRRRSDSYTRLVKNLMSSYGIELRIVPKHNKDEKK